jgi:D-alanyl-lipoteichoic acid acyltransferase DltB (MBOAT superfamily)
MITMLLGGLWHGASWNFVLWGGWHGALLSAERATGRREATRSPWNIGLTFVLVSLGWVLFRAGSLEVAGTVYRALLSPVAGQSLLGPGHWLLVVISLTLAVAQEKSAIFERVPLAPLWLRTSGLAAILLALEIFGVTGERIPFIYFQF